MARHDVRQMLDPSCDFSCVNWPWAELKLWQGGQYYPQCTLCNKWADESHIESVQHLKRLEYYAYQRGRDGQWTQRGLPTTGCKLPEELRLLQNNGPVPPQTAKSPKAPSIADEGSQAARASSTAFATPASSLAEHTWQEIEVLRDLLDPIQGYVACLRDPTMKLQLWLGGPGYSPYCTLCKKWSDESHTQSHIHLKRLQYVGYFQGADGRWHQRDGSPAGDCQLPEELKQLLQSRTGESKSDKSSNIGWKVDKEPSRGMMFSYFALELKGVGRGTQTVGACASRAHACFA